MNAAIEHSTALAALLSGLPGAAVIDGSLGDHAVELAVRGWAVLPLAGKLPRTAHGVDDASTELTQLAEWWTRWPAANIGARVPDRLVVIDIDPRNGGIAGLDRLTTECGPLPETLTVWSGRDDAGRHLYFQRPLGQLSRHRLPAGIDLKTAGYLVMPPSLHPATSRPYRWEHRPPAALPSAWRELLRPQLPSPWRSGDRVATGRGLVEHVARQVAGNRNAALYWAACRAVESGDDDLLEQLVEAAVSVGLPEREARTTVGSARRRIVGAA